MIAYRSSRGGIEKARWYRGRGDNGGRAMTAPVATVPAALAFVGRRARARTATTPGRLRLASLAILVVIIPLWVVAAGALGARRHATGVAGLQTEPLLVGAQGMYASLADADATAANTFLTGGLEPVARHERYVSDLKAASNQLATVARQVGASPVAQQDVTVVTDQLPVYAGLVEAARANNRQGLPVGAAYLREASAMMRDQILPATDRLYQIEATRLDHSYQSGASALDVVGVIVFGAVLLAALILSQLYLARRTNRVLNVPLLVGSILVVVLGAWLLVAFVAEQRHLHQAQVQGSDSVQVLSQARILALRAQGDESLALVARGSGAQYQSDFDNVISKLRGTDGSGGLIGEAGRIAGVSEGPSLQSYLAVHQFVNRLNQTGQFDQAVNQATFAEVAKFDALNTGLTRDIRGSQDSFSRYAAKARHDLRVLSIGIAVLLVATALLAGFGLQQRINEYR
jgi:hypothetical protein